MNELIERLQELNQTVPVPLELPEYDQLVQAEEQLLIGFPRELKEFLLYASDVIVGRIEPVTVSDPSSHTYLPEVASYAWSIGLPRDLLPICQVGDDFYCIDQEGRVYLWQDGYLDEETTWESFWEWVDNVWLAHC
ncbi:MAG: SMI1/KNR4 family protein [Shewanella sp.]|uniref:SMI1/KNR4 family protein n=1 Tax=Shewanella sp. SNU WT4 TaxID=2590015 RepID=UPI00112EB6EF|nr:SMI1/KNR4 family protein [Shewanella sp. SNU WT4]QDF67956.1 SMI1/KNR4 family protein [Shewanella sp. SNU WT4]